MHTAIFWFHKSNDDILKAVKGFIKLTGKQNSNKYTLFTNSGIENTIKIPKHSGPYHFEAINQIQQALSEGIDRNCDFVIVNFGHAFFLSLSKLNDLLETNQVQSNILSVRASEIHGVALKHSLKLPYIDDNFLIFNLRKIKELHFLDRRLIHASHYEHTGKIHAVLLSFLESTFSENEFYNTYSRDNNDNVNEYGKPTLPGSLPFALSLNYGFCSCYTAFNSNLNELLNTNIQHTIDPETKIQKKLQPAQDFFVFKEPLLSKIASFAYKQTRKIFTNFYKKSEFQKTYDEKPKN